MFPACYNVMTYFHAHRCLARHDGFNPTQPCRSDRSGYCAPWWACPLSAAVLIQSYFNKIVVESLIFSFKSYIPRLLLIIEIVKIHSFYSVIDNFSNTNTVIDHQLSKQLSIYEDNFLLYSVNIVFGVLREL